MVLFFTDKNILSMLYVTIILFMIESKLRYIFFFLFMQVKLLQEQIWFIFNTECLKCHVLTTKMHRCQSQKTKKRIKPHFIPFSSFPVLKAYPQSEWYGTAYSHQCTQLTNYVSRQKILASLPPFKIVQHVKLQGVPFHSLVSHCSQAS